YPALRVTNGHCRHLIEASRDRISASWLALSERGWPDVITSRVVRAPRQGLSPSRRENRRPLGARDASQACAGVAAGRACSIQAIEAGCCLWMQGSTGIGPGTFMRSTNLFLPTGGGRAGISSGTFRAALGLSVGLGSLFEPSQVFADPPLGPISSAFLRADGELRNFAVLCDVLDVDGSLRERFRHRSAHVQLHRA